MSDHTDDLTDRLRRSAAGTNAPAPALSPEIVATASSRRAPRLVNHGRSTRFASASLAAVAAVAVGSLVIANPFAPQSPLFTAAAAGSQQGATEAAALADEARIALWIDYQYVAGPGLGTDGGSGGVYQLQRIGTPEQVLADMADRFGVDGEASESEYFDPAWPTYVVGPEDGSGPSIQVTWSGTGNWWYGNPAAYPASVCELVEYESETGIETYEECVTPEVAPADSLAPSEAEARAQAVDLFAAMGLDVEPGDVRVMADVWQTMATANLVVDGVATALDYGVAWSPLGEIAWAYGHSIEVVDRGDFGTVSASDAVDRLDDGRWYGAGGPAYQGGMSILAEEGLARDAVPATDDGDTSVSSPAEEPVEPVEPAPTEPAPTEPGVEEPKPTEPAPTEPGGEPIVEPTAPAEQPSVEPTTEPAPLPEPEQVTVTVDSAEATLLLLWDVNGDAWLVPGYAMQHPDGFWNTIVSLVEGVIELPPPFDGEITPFLED